MVKQDLDCNTSGDASGMVLNLWHPEDVVREPSLTEESKRRLLATWASDERAVLGEPTLRQLPNGAIVSLASILDALKRLDGNTRRYSHEAKAATYSRRHLQMLRKWRRKDDLLRRRWSDNDDDDPPPVPAVCNARHSKPAWA